MAERERVAAPGLLLPAASLVARELLRFFRQRGRVIGALGAPLLFWLFIGSGLGSSFQAGGVRHGYLEYAYPGTMLLIVLFTSIFAAISTIEDRREGFLQSVLVSPARRASIVAGKVLGATAIALVQAALFLLLAPLAGVGVSVAGVAATSGAIALVAFGVAALGLAAAWRTDSVQGFHSVMNLVLMPMWLLSGALFPPEGAPAWLRAVMHANPLTYGLALVRRGLYAGTDAGPPAGLPSFPISLAVAAAFAAGMFAAALALVSHEDDPGR